MFAGGTLHSIIWHLTKSFGRGVRSTLGDVPDRFYRFILIVSSIGTLPCQPLQMINGMTPTETAEEVEEATRSVFYFGFILIPIQRGSHVQVE
jgi:hypothetical protein